MKNRIRLIGNIVMVMTLAFMFMACPDPDPNPNPDPDLPIGEVSQPPTDPALAGEFGVYTSGTNLVIKSGTQVYQWPESGAVAHASSYSGYLETIDTIINSEKVGTIILPANGVLGTTAVAAPADSILLAASVLFEHMFGGAPPTGSIADGTSVLIGQLSLFPLYLFAPNANFQDDEWVDGGMYYYFYSKGDITMQMPLDEVSFNRFVKADIQVKTGWNSIVYLSSGNTITIVSKNPPADARWVHWGYVAPTLNLQF